MNQSATKTAFWAALCAALYLGLFGIHPAQAYLDPGTGSMILQAVIGAVAGALIVIKLYWYKLTSFLRGFKSGAGDAATPPDNRDAR